MVRWHQQVKRRGRFMITSCIWGGSTQRTNGVADAAEESGGNPVWCVLVTFKQVDVAGTNSLPRGR